MHLLVIEQYIDSTMHGATIKVGLLFRYVQLKIKTVRRSASFVLMWNYNAIYETVTYVGLLAESKCGNNNFLSPIESCRYFKEAAKGGRRKKWPLHKTARENKCPGIKLYETLNKHSVFRLTSKTITLHTKKKKNTEKLECYQYLIEVNIYLAVWLFPCVLWCMIIYYPHFIKPEDLLRCLHASTHCSCPECN